jgi:predicted RNase H-like nuclease (RuvC/YqgF family)
MSMLKDILGLDMPMEKILTCTPNTKEYNTIRKWRETRERADNLNTENSDMERRMERMREEIDIKRKEFNNMKENHSQKTMDLNKKIEKLKQSIINEAANKDNAIREQYRDRMEEIQQIINDSQTVFVEKTDVVHQLNSSIVKKVNN